MACFFLVRLGSIEFSVVVVVCVFSHHPHLTPRLVPFLTSLVALALANIISAKQAPQAVRAPLVQSGCPPLRHRSCQPCLTFAP